MSLFHRYTPEPQPKDEPTGLDMVAEKLAEMNRLQAAEHRYKRDGSHIMTNAILGDRQTTIWRELVHEYDVLPVHDEKTGRWTLFNGGAL